MGLFKKNTRKVWNTERYFPRKGGGTRGELPRFGLIKLDKVTTQEPYGTYAKCEYRFGASIDVEGGPYRCSSTFSGPDAARNYCPDCGGPVIKWLEPERKRREDAEYEARKRKP